MGLAAPSNSPAISVRKNDLFDTSILNIKRILSTSTKIANLAKVKQQRIGKIEAELNVQLTSLLTKRKEELFNIFNRFSAIGIDDKLLIGFLKFVTNKDNKDHLIIKEFLTLANITRSPKKKNHN